MARNFSHNKKRNVALLYEFLIRHISKCILNNKKNEATKALDISKRYFAKGTLLNKELNLFNSVLDTKVNSRFSAQKIINEISNLSCKMNYRKLDYEKSQLIKEINHVLNDSSFYDYKIPNYTVYASIQTLLNEKRCNKKNLNNVDKIKLEDNIVEYLITEKKDKTVEALKVNSEYNNAVYKFVIERFHKKYDKILNEGQKKILTKYAVSMISGKNDILKNSLIKESSLVLQKLSKIKDDKILKDDDLMQKLTECKNKIKNINFEEITEQKIMDILQYMKLVEELEN